jgi:hypothetical protein
MMKLQVGDRIRGKNGVTYVIAGLDKQYVHLIMYDADGQPFTAKRSRKYIEQTYRRVA